MGELININGTVYNITNWDEFVKKYLFVLGELIVNSIQDEALRMKLFDSGRFISGISVRSTAANTLVFTSNAPYAEFLEFGTFALGKSFGDSWPVAPLPKKKDISRKTAARMLKGMQPFAPFRRVLYNEQKLARLSKKALAVLA